MKFLKKYYYTLLTATLLLPLKTFAQVGNMNISFSEANPINQGDIYVLIKTVLDFVVKIGAVVVVFYMIFAGFQFVTAQGNEDKISKAKTALLWTIIGALVLLGAMTLSDVVCNTANQLGASVSCGN
jgi:heme/copper-type cytochrome/quinol oxidase subunit 2